MLGDSLEDGEDAQAGRSMAALLDEGVATMDGTVVVTVDGTAGDRLGKNRDQKIVNGKINMSFFYFYFLSFFGRYQYQLSDDFLKFFFGQMRIFGECQ